MSQTAAMANPNRQEPLFSNRFLMKLIAGMAAMALATGGIVLGGEWIGKRIELGGHSDSRQVFTVEIGRDRLSLPANMIRFETQRRDGPAERADLYFLWPEMDGYSPEKSARFNDLSQNRGLVFMQITQSVMSRDMSGRVAPIYSRFFEGAAAPVADGLTLHRFKPEAGYGGDVLLTAPRKGKGDYAVRCVLPEPPAASNSADCQRDFMAGQDLSVLYRFSSDLLPQWRELDAAIANFVSKRLANRTGAAS